MKRDGNNSLGDVVAASMMQILESPEHQKIFRTAAAKPCCPCKEGKCGRKCPCKDDGCKKACVCLEDKADKKVKKKASKECCDCKGPKCDEKCSCESDCSDCNKCGDGTTVKAKMAEAVQSLLRLAEVQEEAGLEDLALETTEAAEKLLGQLKSASDEEDSDENEAWGPGADKSKDAWESLEVTDKRQLIRRLQEQVDLGELSEEDLATFISNEDYVGSEGADSLDPDALIGTDLSAPGAAPDTEALLQKHVDERYARPYGHDGVDDPNDAMVATPAQKAELREWRKNRTEEELEQETLAPEAEYADLLASAHRVMKSFLKSFAQMPEEEEDEAAAEDQDFEDESDSNDALDDLFEDEEQSEDEGLSFPGVESAEIDESGFGVGEAEEVANHKVRKEDGWKNFLDLSDEDQLEHLSNNELTRDYDTDMDSLTDEDMMYPEDFGYDELSSIEQVEEELNETEFGKYPAYDEY